MRARPPTRRFERSFRGGGRRSEARTKAIPQAANPYDQTGESIRALERSCVKRWS